jgi:SAM-dependent methyltransferase
MSGQIERTGSEEREPASGVDRPFAGVESPWDWLARFDHAEAAALCNVCWWSGDEFLGPPHSESATCPGCGSIARDRFLHFCLLRSLPARRYRVLETSPRLGDEYRRAMATWFDYTASDYDERAHRADVQLDLEALDLETDSLDVILSPHVLEHVRDTDRALNEMYRVLKPGGRIYLQVPVQQGWTTPPATPELHGDNTPVCWRFGLDLTERLREVGFRVRLLCNRGFYHQVASGAERWPDPTPDDIDVPALLAAARLDDLVPLADDEETRRLGFHPAYMFLTWEGRKPGADRRLSAAREAR